jgi:hypothetical protein
MKKMLSSANEKTYDWDTCNCCSVAFGSLRELRKDNSTDICRPDLSKIKKRSFNVFGRGIKFDAEDDSYFDYVKGGSRILFDSITMFPKVLVRTFNDLTSTPTPTLTGGDEPEQKEL